MTPPALSAPSASISTLRMYSSVPTPNEVCCSTDAGERPQHARDLLARHAGELRHRGADPLHVLRAQVPQHLRGILLAQRQQQNRRSLHARTRRLASLIARPPRSSRPAPRASGSCVTRSRACTICCSIGERLPGAAAEHRRSIVLTHGAPGASSYRRRRRQRVRGEILDQRPQHSERERHAAPERPGPGAPGPASRAAATAA